MRYIWDREKNLRNWEVHGIDFRLAVLIFDGPTLEVEDDRDEYGEIRNVAYGQLQGRIIAVVYTDREDDERRIISARKAEAYEARAYYEAIFGKGS